MNNEYKDKLREYIFSSNLTSNQKELWDVFLLVSHAEEDEAVYEAVTESREDLLLLTKHLRDKIWHMKENNKSTWRKIIGDESHYAQLLS